jgi:hypothetical protein
MPVLPLQPPEDSNDSNTSCSDRVLERLLLLVFVISFIGGVGFVGVGLLGAQFSQVVMGAMGGAIAWMSREWLCQRGRFDDLVASFYPMILAPARNEEVGDRPLARLAALLRELDEVERHRGSPGFDPWAVQALRNDIHAMIERDPSLARLFERHRQAA